MYSHNFNIVIVFCFFHAEVISSCMDNSTVKQNVYIDAVYLKTHASSIQGCAANCAVHYGCLSFGFEPKTRICHLHTADSSGSLLIERMNWLHSDIGDWPKATFGPCAEMTCPAGNRCHVNRVTRAAVCITSDLLEVGCPVPDVLPNAKVSSGPHVQDSLRTYTCDENYLDTSQDSNEANTTCLVNKTWSSVNLICTGPYIRVETPYEASPSFDTIPENLLERMMGNTSSLVFLVKTCRDANMQLTTAAGERLWILNGGWQNTLTKLTINGVGPQASANTPGILDCDEFRPFWLDWTDGIIAFGKGRVKHMDEVASWTYQGTLEILGIGISTWSDNSGSWLFDDVTANA